MLTRGRVLCYKDLPDKRAYGVEFLVHKGIAGSIDEFYSIIERAAVIVIKLNSRYRINAVQAYAPTFSHAEEIKQFYEDVELAMRKVQPQYTVVIGNFKAKVGRKPTEEQAIDNYTVSLGKYAAGPFFFL